MLSIFTMVADVNVHNLLCYADAVANKLLSSGESKIFPLSSGLLISLHQVTDYFVMDTVQQLLGVKKTLDD